MVLLTAIQSITVRIESKTANQTNRITKEKLFPIHNNIKIPQYNGRTSSKGSTIQDESICQSFEKQSHDVLSIQSIPPRNSMHDLRAGITTSTSHEFSLLDPQETWWINDIINFGSALAKFPGVSYLLETCKVSSYTMHRCAGLEKIELFRPPTRHFLDMTETIPDTLNYLYLRPSIDIFMVSIDSLVRLYRIGGSIGSLCNIQQLAITGMDYNLFDDCDDEEITTLFEKLCNIVEIHCPALEKLHLVIGDTEAVPFGDVKDSLELTRDLRLIEIDDDFQDCDLEEDKERQEYYELESLKEEINNTSEYVQHAMMELRDYIEQTEMLSDSDVADYWRKMKVVPAAVGWLEGEERPQP